MVIGCQPYAPVAFTPRDIPGTMGWVDPRAMVPSEGNMSLKNPVTPPGIDPGTVRLVAQRLNLNTTPGPLSLRVVYTNIGFNSISSKLICSCNYNSIVLVNGLWKYFRKMSHVVRYVYMKEHTGHVVRLPHTDNQGALGMYGDDLAYCKLSLLSALRIWTVLCMLTCKRLNLLLRTNKTYIFGLVCIPLL